MHFDLPETMREEEESLQLFPSSNLSNSTFFSIFSLILCIFSFRSSPALLQSDEPKNMSRRKLKNIVSPSLPYKLHHKQRNKVKQKNSRNKNKNRRKSERKSKRKETKKERKNDRKKRRHSE